MCYNLTHDRKILCRQEAGGGGAGNMQDDSISMAQGREIDCREDKSNDPDTQVADRPREE